MYYFDFISYPVAPIVSSAGGGLAKLFNCVVCNPCQSSPSLTSLVPLWFIIISVVFYHLCKALFSGFLQFKGKFVDGQNTSKYCDRVPLYSPIP